MHTYLYVSQPSLKLFSSQDLELISTHQLEPITPVPHGSSEWSKLKRSPGLQLRNAQN